MKEVKPYEGLEPVSQAEADKLSENRREGMDGLTFREIGKALGISPQYAEQLLKSALKKIEKALARQGIRSLDDIL